MPAIPFSNRRQSVTSLFRLFRPIHSLASRRLESEVDLDYYWTGLSLFVATTTIAFWWFVEWRWRESFWNQLFHSLRSGFSFDRKGNETRREKELRNETLAFHPLLSFLCGVWLLSTRALFTLISCRFRLLSWRSSKRKTENGIGKLPSWGLIITHAVGLSVDRDETCSLLTLRRGGRKAEVEELYLIFYDGDDSQYSSSTTCYDVDETVVIFSQPQGEIGCGFHEFHRTLRVSLCGLVNVLSRSSRCVEERTNHQKKELF